MGAFLLALSKSIYYILSERIDNELKFIDTGFKKHRLCLIVFVLNKILIPNKAKAFSTNLSDEFHFFP